MLFVYYALNINWYFLLEKKASKPLTVYEIRTAAEVVEESCRDSSMVNYKLSKLQLNTGAQLFIVNKDKLKSIFLVFLYKAELLFSIVAIHSKYSGVMKKTFLFLDGWICR